MTSHLARALYDFIGEEEGDLTISAGDVLTVHDHDVGPGWVQATAQDGSQVCLSSNSQNTCRVFVQGIIPESYTEPIEEEVDTRITLPRPYTWDDDDDDDKYDEIPESPPPPVATLERKMSTGSRDVLVVCVDNANLVLEWPNTPPSEVFTCSLGPGKRITKYGGITRFVQFPLTPSFSNIQVNRR